MNPFQRLGVKISNWWRGEPQNDGGKMTLNSPSFLERIGLKRKGKPTSEVTYFTCLKMLSETLAKMPIKYYQKTDKGIIEAEATDTSKLLSKRPNPFMTPTTFWNTVEINRNHYGNGYVYMRKKFDRKKFGGEIKIVDLWVMQSNCVQIVVDDAGIFAGVGRLWYVYTDPTSGRQYVFSTDEVMHFKTSFSFDGITGLPVQQILRDTVAGASESQAFMNNLYESGLTAKATLEYTGELNEKAKEALVKSFEEFGSGAKNTGKILPVPLGMKLTPLDIKLTDSQFFELKKYNALQIAGAFGVKPNQINDYSKSSYSNSEMQQLSFYVDTELFIIKQYEEEINFKMLPDEDTDDGYYYKFNEKVLFRTDSKTQIPDNVEVIINMTKPDKTHVHNDGEKSGNEALIPLTRGMLQVHGTALCEVQLYQNGALLTSATFEMEIFPSQRDESEIIHSGEYTRLENTIAAAREALQIAQDTQNTIDAAEAVRQAQERLREAAEKAREIKESRREDDTAKAIAKCVEAMEAAIEQTKKCLTATEEANKIIISQSGLDAILAAVKDYYERIRELETDININVDGGTPKSTDLLLVKGGTPFTTDYDKYIAGTSHTI